MSRNLSLVAWFLSFVIAPPFLGAEEHAGSLTDIVTAEIAARIAELDHPIFNNRQASSERLTQLGSLAVPELEKTIARGSREASSRSLNILKTHFQSGDEANRVAARQALQRLAESGDVSKAQKARDLLNPPQAVALPTRRGWRPPPFAPFNVMPGGAVGNIAPAVRQIRVTDANGRRTLSVEEAARIVQFELLPGGGIAVEVTDKQNVANPARQFNAKDADDLKQKDAELARIFETHQAALQRVGGLPPQPALNPGVPPVPRAGDAMRAQIAQLDEMIGRYRQRAPLEPAMQRSLESLEQMKAHLEQTAARIAR